MSESLKKAGAAPVSASAVRAQRDRIVQSPDFAGAEQAQALLRFIVDTALAGRADELKEYTIATAVLGRDSSFDPKINPTVRVEAGRLRRRLEHYYLTTGRADPILIEVPRGGYAPQFSANADVLHLHAGFEGSEDAPSPPPPVGPTIAVMPFENMGQPDDAPFAAGLAVELATAVSRFRELRVLGRGTVFAHRAQRDARQLRRELGADYLIEGSLLRESDTVRVHAQLTRTLDAQVLWAHRFEEKLTAASMLAVQDGITSHVVSTLASAYGVIARPETALVRRRPPDRLRAYDCLMLFYAYTADFSAERHLAVRELLEAEVEADPEVSFLWGALAMVHTDTWRFGFNPSPSREAAREMALTAARRAVAADPQDALAYHGLMQAQFAMGNRKGFREAGDRALELNPYNTDLLADYGLHLTMADEWSRGLFLLKLAWSLNPEPPDWYWFPFFSWHLHRGEYEDALEMALRVQSDQFFWTHAMQAMAYGALGLSTAAREAIDRLLALRPDFARHARQELSLWTTPARVEEALSALRNAGLPGLELERGAD